MAGQCRICGQTSSLIADVLSICVDCIRTRPDQVLSPLLDAHAAIRREFDLPPALPT